MKPFYMWVIYEKPSDYPESWVARQWAIYDVPQPTPTALVSPALEPLEDILRNHGFSKLDRLETDEPHILSTWI